MNESYLLDKLRNQGAKIFIGHNKSNISDDVDMVVYTAAIHQDNPEMIATKEKNKLTMDRSCFLRSNNERISKFNSSIWNSR